MTSNDTNNWIDASEFYNTASFEYSNGINKRIKQKEKESRSLLTGFKCSGHKCERMAVWNVNGFQAAKKLALKIGWTFGTKKYLCPECSAKKERIIKRKYNPSNVKSKPNALLKQSIFKE